MVERVVGGQFDAVFDEEPEQGISPYDGGPAPSQRCHEQPTDGDQGGDGLGADDGSEQDRCGRRTRLGPRGRDARQRGLIDGPSARHAVGTEATWPNRSG